MEGPQHYREAEQLLSDASFTRSEHDLSPVTRGGAYLAPATHAVLLARAQVHATLALAAANVLSPLLSHYELPEDIRAWLLATCGPEGEDQADEQPDGVAEPTATVDAEHDDPAHVDGALDRIAGYALTGLPHEQLPGV